MSPASFEELDFQKTSLGDLTLWRRQVLSLPGTIVHEVRLGGEFLMSSLVNESEIALAKLPLSELRGGPLDVLVGGLGLGYTVQAALAFPLVRSVVVVELLEPIIRWHREGLVPLGLELATDPRCEIRAGDFYNLLRGRGDPETHDGSADCFDAILLDIDHSPDYLLRPAHASFYTPEGLCGLKEHLRPGGCFALWSADPLGPGFIEDLEEQFEEIVIHPIDFHNPLLDERDTNHICVARS